MQLLGKTLHDIFKQRTIASANKIVIHVPASDFDQAEHHRARNDVDSDEVPAAECRLTVTIYHSHGVKKTYRLTYAAGPCIVAVADKNSCASHFTASPRLIKDWTDHFMLGKHGTDEVTFWCTGQTCKIKSFEDASAAAESSRRNGSAKDQLGGKQSISTTLTVVTDEFDAYDMGNEQALITIALKEIKALLDFAIGMGDVLHWHFDQGGQPLIVTLESDGLQIEFIMSTNEEDPAGIQREQDVKPRLSQTRLSSVRVANPEQRSNQASATQTPAPSGRPQSTPKEPPAGRQNGRAQQPLFAPPDEDGDNDEDMWNEMDAADPTFSQVAMDLEMTVSQHPEPSARSAGNETDETDRADASAIGHTASIQPLPIARPQMIDMSLDESASEGSETDQSDTPRKRPRKTIDLGVT